MSLWGGNRDSTYSFWVQNANGERFEAQQIRVMDLDESPPIPVDAYRVNDKQYTPKEFWSLYSLVPETNEG